MLISMYYINGRVVTTESNFIGIVTVCLFGHSHSVILGKNCVLIGYSVLVGGDCGLVGYSTILGVIHYSGIVEGNSNLIFLLLCFGQEL